MANAVLLYINNGTNRYKKKSDGNGIVMGPQGARKEMEIFDNSINHVPPDISEQQIVAIPVVREDRR